MSDALKQLETNLDDVFRKKAPALPKSGKDLIVEYLPWLVLIVAFFTVLSAYWLWSWAHTVNKWVDYANTLSAAYGVPNVEPVSRLTVTVWLSLAVLAVQAVLYFAAFPALRARAKKGWDLLFYAALVNIVYGLVVMFTAYGGFGSFLGSLIGTAIGFYFLFQIREAYTGKKSVPAASAAPKTDEK